MAYFKKETGTTIPNFLASEIGIIQKTYQFNAAGVTANAEGKKVVKAGSVYPANDDTAIGIVFEDMDVTNNASTPGSVIIAGRIIKGRLPTAPAATAVTAMNASGIVFIENEPQTTRP